ncbi:MAG TPA: hypothetical protein VHG28_04635 [Longimicrobiaceae bacterium]|nr:hypothetical protein [Longimicrobiaceae bacterium]
MSVPWLAARRVEVGVALAPGGLWAAVPGDRLWTRALETSASPDGTWQELREALGELAGYLAPASPVLHVALLPALAQVRWVQLPPLGEDELRRVISREAGRYFPGPAEPRAVGVERVLRGDGSGRVLAVTAARPLLDAVHSAAAEAGCRVVSVVPAYSAWAAAAGALWPAIGRARGALLVAGEDRIEVVHVERGRLTFLRRLPATGCDPARLLDALGERPQTGEQVAVVGPEPLRSLVGALLGAEGVHPAEPAAGSSFPESAEGLAAAFAPRASGPSLLREREHAGRRRRASRRTLWFAAAAGVLLLTTAGLELWGARRELDAVRARRETIRASVGEVVAVREAIGGLNGRLTSLAELEGSAPRWSDVVARVADHLPRDAHLTAFRGQADTLVLEGAAGRAGGVIAAMQRVPGLVEVRAGAPIRRETDEGGGAVDRFSLVARVVWVPGEVTR